MCGSFHNKSTWSALLARPVKVVHLIDELSGFFPLLPRELRRQNAKIFTDILFHVIEFRRKHAHPSAKDDDSVVNGVTGLRSVIPGYGEQRVAERPHRSAIGKFHEEFRDVLADLRLVHAAIQSAEDLAPGLLSRKQN
jgi:hypothetical protein